MAIINEMFQQVEEQQPSNRNTTMTNKITTTTAIDVSSSWTDQNCKEVVGA
jgi:hypothetical protein